MNAGKLVKDHKKILETVAIIGMCAVATGLGFLIGLPEDEPEILPNGPALEINVGLVNKAKFGVEIIGYTGEADNIEFYASEDNSFPIPHSLYVSNNSEARVDPAENSEIFLKGKDFTFNRDVCALVMFDCSELLAESFNSTVFLEFDYSADEPTDITIKNILQSHDYDVMLVPESNHISLMQNTSKLFIYRFETSDGACDIHIHNASIRLATGDHTSIVTLDFPHPKSGVYPFRAVINGSEYKLNNLVLDVQRPIITMEPSRENSELLNISTSDFTIIQGIVYRNASSGTLNAFSYLPDREIVQVPITAEMPDVFIVAVDQAGNYQTAMYRFKAPENLTHLMFEEILTGLGVAAVYAVAVCRYFGKTRKNTQKRTDVL